MGRMFRIITEGGQEMLHPPEPMNRVSAPVTVPTPAPEPFVPYVEIGGPEGVVTSVPKRATPTITRIDPPAPRPKPKTEPEPIPTPDARVLSVAFHRVPKPGLRMIPAGIASEVVAYHRPEHPISGEYRAVRDEIRRQFEDPGARSLLFTAAATDAGTTTVLLNFAVALTQETGNKVLVVDANFVRPSVGRRLGVADAPGLAEVLSQTTPLAWAIQPTAVQSLHVLSAGAPAAYRAGVAATEFPRLLTQMRQWFDWILVDAGVWSEMAGRDVVSTTTDAVYLVSRQADFERSEFANLRNAVTATSAVLRGYITTR
ncbi:tyrosine-protein kinase family protein [Fimbriiglobus ruber]|uniref:Tyrosine-protein kinase EpsD n=1 Tax=Fimbriiglobus ruber TaxID=1908690 RepID=A0A225E584_9BACT|nr:hypothetical protein [Fimbriiglobus ruber]OWK46924.1 Tyrosine-protein kinase EpsD [Fimbriiglobus ruber]